MKYRLLLVSMGLLLSCQAHAGKFSIGVSGSQTTTQDTGREFTQTKTNLNLGWSSAVWVHLGWGGRGFLLAALCVVFSGYYGILTSRTSFDGHTIEQTWLWSKRVTLPEITQVKLIQVRGLEWLIVPRLVVRRGSLGLMTFHAADPRVLAGFRGLAYGPQ